jgi:hypothetical protein
LARIVAYWTRQLQFVVAAAGIWIFDGSASGLAPGRHAARPRHIGRARRPADVPIHSYYLGFYGQDTWRATIASSLNLGLRWEPYFGVNVDNNAVYNFNIDNFRKGIKSQVFVNAPAGAPLSRRPGLPIRQRRV